ncbi:hypothetical protein [Paenibacillus apiarius]|uniref:hypothetical protein n=1 Tax=Paenibacillus apiarius TaxID=46240 RepID=UPI003B3A0446
MYSPRVNEKGYYYHVNIYQEALLTYEQQLKKEHGVNPCTSDPEDSTNYHALDWCKNGSISFAEKDWNEFVIRLRGCFKLHSGLMLQTEGDLNRHYIYHIGTVIGLKGKYLIRSHFHITHSASFEMDTERFAQDLTRIGRWENK